MTVSDTPGESDPDDGIEGGDHAGEAPARWFEVAFEVGLDDVDAWSDALFEAGALSVDAQDADADSLDEQPLYGEPGLEPPSPGWRRTRLAVLFDADADASAALAEAATAIGREAPADPAVRTIAEQDWVRLTQAQFEPIPIGERLLITPSWHAEAALEGAAAGRVGIELDPGLAFGTGSHPTTRLCLEWLERELPAGATVIDYGCGSGILAIAAAKLGASRVVAIDIDPQALDASRANAAVNGVGDDVLLVQATDGPRPESADVVVANILSMPLKLLAPALSALVAPGGALVLSGVLARQADDVATAYAGLLPVAVAGERDGWVCLSGRRPPE